MAPKRPQSIFFPGRFDPGKHRDLSVPDVSGCEAKMRIEQAKLMLEKNGILP